VPDFELARRAVHGATAPKDTVNRVTKKVIALLAEWWNRAPESAASIDTIHVNLRDTRATNLSNGC
jgi:hypothetical protein